MKPTIEERREDRIALRPPDNDTHEHIHQNKSGRCQQMIERRSDDREDISEVCLAYLMFLHSDDDEYSCYLRGFVMPQRSVKVLANIFVCTSS